MFPLLVVFTIAHPWAFVEAFLSRLAFATICCSKCDKLAFRWFLGLVSHFPHYDPHGSLHVDHLGDLCEILWRKVICCIFCLQWNARDITFCIPKLAVCDMFEMYTVWHGLIKRQLVKFSVTFEVFLVVLSTSEFFAGVFLAFCIRFRLGGSIIALFSCGCLLSDMYIFSMVKCGMPNIIITTQIYLLPLSLPILWAELLLLGKTSWFAGLHVFPSVLIS